MSDYAESIKVTVMVTVEMTPDQQAAYAEAHGALAVDMEIRGRAPREFAEAIRSEVSWARRFATVTAGKARILRPAEASPDTKEYPR